MGASSTTNSTRHIELSRKNGDAQVLPNDQIWSNAETVWANLPNEKIASGYVHAYRVAEKVIKAKGSNKFLGAGSDEGLHAGIRKDFAKSENGICRRDNKKVAAPCSK